MAALAWGEQQAEPSREETVEGTIQAIIHQQFNHTPLLQSCATIHQYGCGMIDESGVSQGAHP